VRLAGEFLLGDLLVHNGETWSRSSTLSVLADMEANSSFGAL